MQIVQIQDIEQRLRAALHPHMLRVIDQSASHAGHDGANSQLQGTHFLVQIASQSFTSLSRVKQHRLVYDALSDLMQPKRIDGIHALAIDIL